MCEESKIYMQERFDCWIVPAIFRELSLREQRFDTFAASMESLSALIDVALGHQGACQLKVGIIHSRV